MVTKVPEIRQEIALSQAKFTELCLELKRAGRAIQFSFGWNPLFQLDAFKMGPFVRNFCVYFAVYCSTRNSDSQMLVNIVCHLTVLVIISPILDFLRNINFTT